jgi:hypothetical protein
VFSLRTLAHVNANVLIAHAEYWSFRLGGFIVLNVLDDPAWLALMFC